MSLGLGKLEMDEEWVRENVVGLFERVNWQLVSTPRRVLESMERKGELLRQCQPKHFHSLPRLRTKRRWATLTWSMARGLCGLGALKRYHLLKR